MHYSILLLSGLSALTTVSAHPTHSHLEARQVPSKPCSKLTGGAHVINAPGAGNSNPPYGLIGSLSQSILRALPGSSNVTIPYDHSNPNGIQQASDGAATLRTYIQQYQQSCPYTRIVLLGYSSGGIMTMDTLCGETSPPYASTIPPLSIPTYSGNLIAAITYGEETRTAGTDYNYGTCTVNGPHPRSSAALANCEKWHAILRNYCDSDDDQCCNSGTTNAAHYTYPQRYDQDATNFVVAQFNARPQGA